VTNKLTKRYGTIKANKFEIVGEEEVSFKMIRSNATILSKELDELNKHLKKFMCLNDNIEHKEKIDVTIIKEMLVQFYESMFPHRSNFELPLNKRNQFAYIHHYNQWNDKQIIFKSKIYIVWIVFFLLTLFLCSTLKVFISR
jgi:UDP-N-acetylglucosamine-lysosomal-enzyme